METDGRREEFMFFEDLRALLRGRKVCLPADLARDCAGVVFPLPVEKADWRGSSIP
jgi:hypothetical protein